MLRKSIWESHTIGTLSRAVRGATGRDVSILECLQEHVVWINSEVSQKEGEKYRTNRSLLLGYWS